RQPCSLKMQIAAPAVLVGKHVSVTGRDGGPRGWQMQIKPGPHVYVPRFSPIKARMRKDNLASTDEQREKRHGGEPMGHANNGSVPRLPRNNGHGRCRSVISTALKQARCRTHDCESPVPVACILHPEPTPQEQFAPQARLWPEWKGRRRHHTGCPVLRILCEGRVQRTRAARHSEALHSKDKSPR